MSTMQQDAEIETKPRKRKEKQPDLGKAAGRENTIPLAREVDSPRLRLPSAETSKSGKSDLNGGREQVTETQRNAPDQNHAPGTQSQQVIFNVKDVAKLMLAASKGDDHAQKQLDSIFDHNPKLKAIFADVSSSAKNGWLDRLAPTNTVIRKLLAEQFVTLRQELSDDTGTDKVEQLLNDQVAISLLQLSSLDAASANLPTAISKEASIAISMSTKAHSRLLRTIDSLTMLRTIKARAS